VQIIQAVGIGPEPSLKLAHGPRVMSASTRVIHLVIVPELRLDGYPLSTVIMEAGRVTGMNGVMRDVTERERAQAEAQQARRRLESTFASLGDAVLVVEPATRRVLMCNDAVARVFGYSPREVVGKTTESLHVDHSTFEDFGKRSSQVLDRGSVFHIEYEMRRRDGSVFPTEISVSGIRDARGDRTSVVSVVRDITERKQAEQALRETEEQLRQSQRMEAVGRLAGGVAHDFNNLLTAIIGHADLLLTEVEPGSESRRDVEGIRASADRAAALTRQLLAFSRRQTLQPHVFNLGVVVQSMADLLTRLIGEDTDLVFREDPALWPVEADPGQVEQVIMNLALNAWDAMPDGGKLTLETANVELGPDYVATHSEAESGPHVMLAVSDTGTGIDPDVLPYIFEPFFTTKELGKGTGLGLSTVYGIVKQSGGNVRVYSEPGQGTTFKLYFPRAGGSVDWAPEGTSAQKGRVDGGNETILVVEDEPAVRALTVRVLEAAGYTVLQEGDPAEALKLYEEHGGLVHLLLTDVILPGMSGRTLADTITARQGVSPKVLFMSGYTQNAIVHEGRLDVGVDFLGKPFAPDALLRKVREVLDRPQDRQLETDV
ncbi:MAG: PAS domain S-box protein, partial [Actinobacteria bacterium]|nr:PAS domain S-box protein [Actinomycetota bacterium]